MRYKITFAYDGSFFHGFERQPSLKTVEGEIEKVLKSIFKKDIDIVASGRTDKGVHALNQVAHFDLDIEVKPYSIKKLLNDNLNKEIYINKVEVVDNNFHARYSAKNKTYCYYINTSTFNVFKKDYIYQYNKKLDTDKMKKALSLFVGEHDYRSFCKCEKEQENCVRKITKATLEEKDSLISIRLTANGFLRNMVRNIVGLLIEVGSNKKDIKEVKKILDSNGIIRYNKSAPSSGLYLEKINY